VTGAEEPSLPASQSEQSSQPAWAVCEPGTIKVARSYTKEGELVELDESSEKIDVAPFVTDVAHITFGTSFTQNLLDFCSVKSEVRVSLPCHREEVADCYKTARRIAMDAMAIERAEMGLMYDRRRAAFGMPLTGQTAPAPIAGVEAKVAVPQVPAPEGEPVPQPAPAPAPVPSASVSPVTPASVAAPPSPVALSVDPATGLPLVGPIAAAGGPVTQ